MPLRHSVRMVAFWMTVTSARSAPEAPASTMLPSASHHCFSPGFDASCAPPRPPAALRRRNHTSRRRRTPSPLRVRSSNRLALRHHQIRDLALLDAPQPVRHAVDFCRRQASARAPRLRETSPSSMAFFTARCRSRALIDAVGIKREPDARSWPAPRESTALARELSSTRTLSSSSGSESASLSGHFKLTSTVACRVLQIRSADRDSPSRSPYRIAGCFSSAANRSMRSTSTQRFAGSRMRLRFQHAFERPVVFRPLHPARVAVVDRP